MSNLASFRINRIKSLISQNKINIGSGNQSKIQYCCHATIFEVTSLKTDKVLPIHISNVQLKFGYGVMAQMINQSLLTKIFPNKLKITKIWYYWKKNDCKILDKFRQISWLASISKESIKYFQSIVFIFYSKRDLLCRGRTVSERIFWQKLLA